MKLPPRPKISVIIRCYNESKWISLCLKKLLNQTIKPFEILVLDNNSNDGTDIIIKQEIDIVKYIRYQENYIPGKMLNYGISKCKGDYVLIISAHCIPCDDSLVENLLKPLINNQNICASYSRQIPLNFSDDLTIRDLVLTYGPESRLQKTDPQFNNACSLIRKKEWKNQKFDEDMTNLEDRYWASKKIKQKKFIYYSSESKVFHHHGSHHNNDLKRLNSTKKTILSKKKGFNIKHEDLNLSVADILPVYFNNNGDKIKLSKNLTFLKKNFKQKLLVFLGQNIKFKSTKNIKFVKRDKKELRNEDYYLTNVINYYKKTILKSLKNNEYLLICGDNFDKISQNYLKSVIQVINNSFPDIIFSAVRNNEPIFSDEDGRIIRLDKVHLSRKENKGLFIAQRDCGVIMHASNLFKKDKFSGKIKLIKLDKV